ncbi:hypothetical protein GGP41_002584 [Bipolaris sorokiniana]|uniref:Prion-inhibition and propagation HeLo domain-containing protein n=1 Tax=Cochliobolus sativus TaxID=45130 RepID=A0A8H5ZLN8_COCSA|nr:hypothetical protein GGP41_002584 [Bipolaris sorokiniana]
MSTKPTTDYVESTEPPGTKTKAQMLTDVFSLASQFSTCVEAFNRIHPTKDHDHAQKVALAKLGIQQGRLLIFGDAVGISAPPATIARHMIPSHPGITNPDPTLPVNFGVRDPRLDEEVINAKIRRALHEIAGRPSNMSRDELMSVYGLKSPKTFSKAEYPALDSNRLEGFREKYGLLKDLLTQTGARSSLKRNLSMTTSHWQVKDTARFNEYVKTVRTEVDALIDLMGVKEQVDLQETRPAPAPVSAAPKVLLPGTRKPEAKSHIQLAAERAINPNAGKDKRPSWLSAFKFKSWNKSTKQNPQQATLEKQRSNSVPTVDPQRSLSAVEIQDPISDSMSPLQAVRSKSVGAIPQSPQFPTDDLDSRIHTLALEGQHNGIPPIAEDAGEVKVFPVKEGGVNGGEFDKNMLVQVETAKSEGRNEALQNVKTTQSYIDRHDMYPAVGRIETKDIRNVAHVPGQ